MNVNFDQLRKRLIKDHNSLVTKLNEARGDDMIHIETKEIEFELDNIRMGLVTLAFLYQDGEGGFESLHTETEFSTFNE